MGAIGERLHSRIWICLLLLPLGLLLQCTHAQKGFISIDCGATSNYTDNVTGIFWSTDDTFITTGVNKAVVSNASLSFNAVQMGTARSFPKPQSKNCYVLPVEVNGTYLIRALFLFGNLEDTVPQGYRFKLSIDPTIVLSFQLSQSDVNTLYGWEFVVASTKDQIDVCILPSVGKAFISSLELRPLLSTMYAGVVYGSRYLKMLYRLNCGAAPTDLAVRYPDDSFDRSWGWPQDSFGGAPRINTTNEVFIPPDLYGNPPEKVLQSAWDFNGTISFDWTFQEAANTFYLGVYFAEIENIKSTDFRSLDMYINGEANSDLVNHDYNFSTSAGELLSEHLPISGDTINITLKQSDISTLPPILNAAEFYAVYDTILAWTARSDLFVLTDLRNRFNLLDWTGDPCLPVAWDWLNCTSTTPLEVVEVKLSGYNLDGPIPEIILNLALVTDLWLDHNNLSGTIPDFSFLTKLRTLHLQNNSLSGPIPASLASLPFLTELFLEGNHLDPVPRALLDKRGLTLRADAGSSSRADDSSYKTKSYGVTISVATRGALLMLVIIVNIGF